MLDAEKALRRAYTFGWDRKQIARALLEVQAETLEWVATQAEGYQIKLCALAINARISKTRAELAKIGGRTDKG